MTVLIRPYQSADEAKILRLNLEFEHDLSPMDSQRFAELRAESAVLLVAEHAGAVAGFLLGFTDNAKYDSTNYQWFLRNVNQFFYVDRVAVSTTARGLGVGSQFYREATAWALSQSLDKIVAEINVEPPNRASLNFHRKLGFRELATQKVDASKVVSLQCLDLC